MKKTKRVLPLVLATSIALSPISQAVAMTKSATPYTTVESISEIDIWDFDLNHKYDYLDQDEVSDFKAWKEAVDELLGIELNDPEVSLSIMHDNAKNLIEISNSDEFNMTQLNEDENEDLVRYVDNLNDLIDFINENYSEIIKSKYDAKASYVFTNEDLTIEEKLSQLHMLEGTILNQELEQDTKVEISRLVYGYINKLKAIQEEVELPDENNSADVDGDNDTSIEEDGDNKDKDSENTEDKKDEEKEGEENQNQEEDIGQENEEEQDNEDREDEEKQDQEEQEKDEEKEDDENSKEEFSKESFINNSILYIDRDTLYIDMPEVKDYKVKFSISVDDKIKRIGELDNLPISLPSVSEKTDFDISIAVIDNDEVIEEFTFTKTFEDNEAPVIEYAYIHNGVLKIQYSDNYQLDDRPLEFKFDTDRVSRRTNNPEIYVSGPAELSVRVHDAFGNYTEMKWDVSSSDQILYGKVPHDIEDLLTNENISKFKGLYSLAVVNLDKEVNIHDLFSKQLHKTFGNRKMSDINFESELDIDNEGNLTSSEAGLNEIKVTAKGSEEEIYLYMYVASPEVKQHNIKNITIEKEKSKTSTQELSLIDLIDVEWSNNSKEEYRDIDVLFIKDGNNITPITSKIELKSNSVNRFTVIDIVSGKEYRLRVDHDKDSPKLEVEEDNKDNQSNNENIKVKLKSTTPKPADKYVRYYYDVLEGHWAQEGITRTTSIGVFTGYPDRFFRGERDISMREFLNMYGKFLYAIEDDYKKPIVNNVDVNIKKGSWGEAETKNVLNRISPEDLNKLDLKDLYRPMTREEVAFILGQTLNIGDDTSNNKFDDISRSKYMDEINILANSGKVNGFPDGEFKPSNKISRAEVAVMISNMF